MNRLALFILMLSSVLNASSQFRIEQGTDVTVSYDSDDPSIPTDWMP